MMGCPVAWKCLVACLLGESSQQPTWPQLRQIRKCSHTLPLFRHSSQPSALGVTSRMPAMWVQPFVMLNLCRLNSTGFCSCAKAPAFRYRRETRAAPPPPAHPRRSHRRREASALFALPAGHHKSPAIDHHAATVEPAGGGIGAHEQEQIAKLGGG